MKKSPLRKRRAVRAASIEALETRIAPASLASITNGNINISGDQSGPGQIETLSISVTGGVLHINDASHAVTAGNGFTQNGPNDASISLAALTGDFTINTGTGADSVNFTSVLVVPGALSVTASSINSTPAAALTLQTGQSFSMNASGSVTLNGSVVAPGTLSVSFSTPTVVQITNPANDFGTVTVNGASDVFLRDDGGFALGPISATTTLTLESAGTITQAGAISGGTSLTKLGAGALILSNANTYTGTTSVNAGTLVVNGSIADGAAATDVTVAAGTVLVGNGMIGGAVSNSGIVRPGGSGAIGKLTIVGSYTQTTPGLLEMEIAGAAAGQSDQLAIGGLATLAGTLKVSGINGFTPSGLESYTLLTHGSRSGIFETVNKPPGSGVNYQASSTTLAFNTDLIVNGTSGDDSLMLTLQGAPGYVLNGGPFVPLGAVPGFVFNGGAGNDTFTVDLRSGNPMPPTNGVTFNGEAENAGLDDQLKIIGGTQGSVQYTFLNAHDGSVGLGSLGLVKFTGIGPLINSGGQADITFNLPGAGGNNLLLGDDGVPANGLSRLGGAAIPQTDFSNPSNSLTISPGTGTDSLMIGALPDFDRALTVGMATARFGFVGVQAPITLTGSSDFTVFGGGVQLATGAALTIRGATLIDATGPISLQAGSSITSTNSNITITSSGSQLLLDSASLSTSGAIILGGHGDATLGEGVLLQQASVTSTGFDVIITGRGGSAATPNHGVHVGAGTTLSAAGNLSITGVAGGASTSANNVGVLIDGGAQISSAGMTIDATGGTGTGGGNHGLVLTGTNSKIAATGTFQMSGTAGEGTTSVGVMLGSGATLEAGGTITGDVTNNGATIRPAGNSVPGKLTITGAFTQASGTLELDLMGSSPGMYDVLAVGSGSTLGGTLSLQVLGVMVNDTDTFTLVERAGTAAMPGTFAGQPEGSTVLFNGVTKRVTYAGGDGNDVALIVPAPGATLDAQLSGGVLTISDASSTGRDNALTVVRSGSDLLITDAAETFAVALPGGALLNGDHTMSVPLSLISEALNFDLADGADMLTLDFTAGNVLEAASISFVGGNPTAGPGDKLIIVGGAQGVVTYDYTSAHDGSVTMSNYGLVMYTGLEPIVNSGSATDVIFNLPPTANSALLSDDGTSGNGLSRLSGANFEQTDFANPTGSLTINRGTAGDALTINALPDFTASVNIGDQTNFFNSITFTGAITLTSGASLQTFSQLLGSISSATITTSGVGGSQSLHANAMILGGFLSAGGNAVRLAPLDPGTLIDIGGSDAAGPPAVLGLTATELSHITAGLLQIGDGSSGALKISAAITAGAIAQINQLELQSDASITGTAAITLGAGRNLVLTADGPISLSGPVTVPGTLTLNAGNADLTLTNAGNALGDVIITNGGTVSLRDDGGFHLGGSKVSKLLMLESAGDITQSGVLSGAGGLTKAGAGTLTLSMANTFSGPTQITGGTLVIAQTLAAQNSTVSVTRDGALLFSDTTDFTLGGLSGPGDLLLMNVAGGSIELRVGNNNLDTTYSGDLSGLSFLHKTGTGKLTLTGKNIQTGGTTIDAGALWVGNDAALGPQSVPLTFNGGGTLHATASFTATRNLVLNGGTETFEAAAGRTLTLAGLISGNGNLAIAGPGKVEITNGKSTNTGSQQLDSNATTVINGVTVSAPGAKGSIVITPGALPNSIALVDLSGATNAVKLTITGPKGVAIDVDRIINTDPTHAVTSIVLGKTVTLGNGVADALPEIGIAGKLGKLQLNDVRENALITLGKGLAYLDTYKNAPTVVMHDVLSGMVIDVTGDGVTPGGVGGGGLGNVTVNSWAGSGVIKTTQSIRNITIKHGNFGGQVVVDPNHLGAATVANVGNVTVLDGAWVGPGMAVEGIVAKFLTEGVIDGTTISAGAFGAVTIKGDFSGSLIATYDANVTATAKGKTTITATGNIGTIGIVGDFTGLISGDGKVGNVTVSGTGRFEGTLHGGTLGNITASIFTGTPTGPEPRGSITSATSIGAIKATVGGLTDYLIAAGTSFGADGKADGVNDVYTSSYVSGTKTLAVKIGSITIKGAVAGTTVAAGVDPGVDNSGMTPVYGLYGNGDTLVPLPVGTVGTTSIGLMKFETSGTPTLAVAGSTSLPVVNAFLAQTITGVQFGTAKTVLTAGTQYYIDSGGSSILVQLLA